MLQLILRNIAPHYCYGCDKIGTCLCDNCKYNIVEERFEGCIVCERPCRSGICNDCKTSYAKAWCVGQRADVLEHLVNGLKFERAKESAVSMAELLHAVLPVLPNEVHVVAVPTIARHIRQRGYDHTALIAKRFARLRGLQYGSPLVRSTKDIQIGANKRQRFLQAKGAFTCPKKLDGGVYLLIDDVVTTNATLRYAAAALLQAGATEVWVAVIARQSLDNKA